MRVVVEGHCRQRRDPVQVGCAEQTECAIAVAVKRPGREVGRIAGIVAGDTLR